MGLMPKVVKKKKKKIRQAIRFESTFLMLRIMTHYNSIKIINIGFTFF